MHARSHIEVDAELCKSCCFCIAPCPQSILEVGEQQNSRGYLYVRQIYGDGIVVCTGCKTCAVLCPESAITVKED